MPKDILPSEYGGQAGSIEYLSGIHPLNIWVNVVTVDYLKNIRLSRYSEIGWTTVCRGMT